MSSFIQLTSAPNPSPVLLNVAHIVEVWPAAEKGVGCGLVTVSQRDEEWCRIAESYDEIVALLSLTGHDVNDRTAEELIKEAGRDGVAHAERLRNAAGWKA